MDKLDQLIADKVAEIEKLAKEIERAAIRHDRLVIELDTLRHAARMRPLKLSPDKETRTKRKPKKVGGGKKGRQAGDISHEWRAVLGKIRSMHRRVSYADVLDVAQESGIVTMMPNVRERVRTMVENDLMTGTAEQGFLVSAEAVKRFGLDKND